MVSKPDTRCQALSSIHDPFSSTLSPVNSLDLSQYQASADLRNSHRPAKSYHMGDSYMLPNLEASMRYSIGTFFLSFFPWTTLSSVGPEEILPEDFTPVKLVSTLIQLLSQSQLTNINCANKTKFSLQWCWSLADYRWILSSRWL